jgi:hypothetical protein
MTKSKHTLPLDLAQMLEEEYTYLTGAPPWEKYFDSGWLVQEEHITDELALATQLLNEGAQSPDENILSYIKLTLDPAELARVKELIEGISRGSDLNNPSQELRSSLARIFNKVVKDRKFYSPWRFSHIILDRETQELLKLPTNHTGVLLLNRLLLEQAFPQFLKRIKEVRLDNIYKVLHGNRRAALCLSGRGVRGTAFGLGVLQGLARHNLLDKFDYMSTSGGGGYIGSWLSAWTVRHPEGLDGVARELKGDTKTCLNTEPHPTTHIRIYKDMIGTSKGYWSSLTFADLVTYTRNLLLLWLVLIPFLATVLLLPRFYMTLLMEPAIDRWRESIFPFGGILGSIALIYLHSIRPTQLNQTARLNFFRWRVDTSSFLKWFLVPLISAGVFFSIGRFRILSDTTGPSWEKFIGSFLFFLAIYFGPAFIFSVDKDKTSPKLSRWFIPAIISAIIGAVLTWGASIMLLNTIGLDKLNSAALYACLALPIFLLIFLITTSANFALMRKAVSFADKIWWRRVCGWLLLVTVGWAIFSAAIIWGPSAVLTSVPVVAIIGVLCGAIGVTLLNRVGRGSLEPYNYPASRHTVFVDLLFKLAPFLAICILIILLSWLTSLGLGLVANFIAGAFPDAKLIAATPSSIKLLTSVSGHVYIVENTSLSLLIIFTFLAIFINLTLDRLIDLNRLTLNAERRGKLVEVFIAASARKQGFNQLSVTDAEHDIPMAEILETRGREIHVENMGALFVKLIRHKDPISNFIWEHLSSNTKDLMTPRGHELDFQAFPALSDDLKRLSQEAPRLGPTEREYLRANYPTHIAGWSLNPYVLNLVYPQEIRLRSAKGKARGLKRKLLHVVNCTFMRHVTRPGPWSVQKEESFCITPLHSGAAALGFRATSEYGGRDGLSLGTAITISSEVALGFARYSATWVGRFLLLFLNLREGWWVGSPGLAGAKTYHLSKPRSIFRQLFSELTGKSDAAYSYVKLSGGEEYDALGLYEMVLRRCRYIFMVDGTEDPEFKFVALGNAVRNVRVDLGIPIEFSDIPMSSRNVNGQDRLCATGRIRYSSIDANLEDGTIIYVKPAFYGQGPRDVISYAEIHKSFPHETESEATGNTQFESYRALGSYILDQISGGEGVEFKSLDRFVKKAFEHKTAEQNYRVVAGRDVVDQVSENVVGRIKELIEGPKLKNYQGYVCANVLTEEGEAPRDKTSNAVTIVSDKLYRLAVWLQPKRARGAFTERVEIRKGEDAKIIQFEIALLCDSLTFDKERNAFQVSYDGQSKAIDFLFNVPEPPGIHIIWVQLMQQKQTVQVLQVTLQGPEAAQNQGENMEP